MRIVGKFFAALAAVFLAFHTLGKSLTEWLNATELFWENEQYHNNKDNGNDNRENDNDNEDNNDNDNEREDNEESEDNDNDNKDSDNKDDKNNNQDNNNENKENSKKKIQQKGNNNEDNDKKDTNTLRIVLRCWIMGSPHPSAFHTRTTMCTCPPPNFYCISILI